MGKRYDPRIIPKLEVLDADGRFLEIVSYEDGQLSAGEIIGKAKLDDEASS